jgi:Tfp pilus assembly PilM family ATPase
MGKAMTITAGISFSPNTCRMVLLTQRKQSFSYHHPRTIPHAFDNFSELPTLLSSLQLPKKTRVIVGIPAEKTMTHDFTLDAHLSDTEILQYLKSRAIELFGHDSEHLCLDYEKQFSDEKAKQKIHVIAAHHTMIQHIQSSFEDKKIYLKAIDVDNKASIRAKQHTAAHAFLSAPEMRDYTTAVGLCLWGNA